MNLLVDPSIAPNHIGIGARDSGTILVAVTECCSDEVRWHGHWDCRSCGKELTIQPSDKMTSCYFDVYEIRDRGAYRFTNWVVNWTGFSKDQFQIQVDL